MARFRRVWWSSLLWAIPVAYLVCAVGFTGAVVIGMIGDGSSDSASDYLSAGLVSFFLWGTVIFLGTCYVSVPVVGIAIAVLRCLVAALRSWRRDHKGHQAVGEPQNRG